MSYICEEHDRILDPEEETCIYCEMEQMSKIEGAADRALNTLRAIIVLVPELKSHAVTGAIEELERALGYREEEQFIPFENGGGAYPSGWEFPK